jgi:hypothetical protein
MGTVLHYVIYKVGVLILFFFFLASISLQDSGLQVVGREPLKKSANTPFSGGAEYSEDVKQ